MLNEIRINDFDREFRTQATAPAATETVGGYLNKRLRQIGVGHVFCIPGDYLAEWAMTLDDPTINAGLVRVHPNNETTATYAADGYGRVANETVGCVAFTYGAGMINAAQAVAGAYVERSPVVLINGSPSVAQFNSDRDQGVMYHHTVGGGQTDLQIFREITEIAVRIDNPATAPGLIDVALQTCLTASRPVYIELANQTSQMACSPVPDTPLRASQIPASPASVAEACGAVMDHLRAARRVVVVGGVEIARQGLQSRFAELVAKIDAPYATSALGKSVLSEFRTDLRFAGVYFGKSSPKNLQELMESADCILDLGVLNTDFNYLGVVTPDYNPATASHLPGPTHIQARDGAVLVGRGLAYWGDVGLAALIDALLTALDTGGALPNAPFPGLHGSPFQIPPPSTYPAGDPITYDSFTSLLQYEFLDGARRGPLPADRRRLRVLVPRQHRPQGRRGRLHRPAGLGRDRLRGRGDVGGDARQRGGGPAPAHRDDHRRRRLRRIAHRAGHRGTARPGRRGVRHGQPGPRGRTVADQRRRLLRQPRPAPVRRPGPRAPGLLLGLREAGRGVRRAGLRRVDERGVV